MSGHYVDWLRQFVKSAHLSDHLSAQQEEEGTDVGESSNVHSFELMNSPHPFFFLPGDMSQSLKMVKLKTEEFLKILFPMPTPIPQKMQLAKFSVYSWSYREAS